MSQNKHLYVSLDSDILRSLAIIEPYYSNNIYYDYNTSDDPILKNYFGYLLKLLDRAKNNDDLWLLVTTTTFYEVRHKKPVLEFINKWCYIPKQTNLLDLEFNKKRQKIKDLAYAYCGAGKPYDPTNPPPMAMRYISEIGAYCPTNDCYVMAEATVENAILITNNRKDFIYNKNIPDDQNSRVLGIVNINNQFGFFDEFNCCPRPFAISTFGPMLKMPIEELRLILSEDSTKFKASELSNE